MPEEYARKELGKEIHNTLNDYLSGWEQHYNQRRASGVNPQQILNELTQNIEDDYEPQNKGISMMSLGGDSPAFGSNPPGSQGHVPEETREQWEKEAAGREETKVFGMEPMFFGAGAIILIIIVMFVLNIFL